jgi:hypothetical protein
MVSLKTFVPLLTLALQAAALPSTNTKTLTLEKKMVCLAPSNCSPIGGCAYCCNSGVTPDSDNCHTHGSGGCGAGQTNYHCDDEHFVLVK